MLWVQLQNLYLTALAALITWAIRTDGTGMSSWRSELSRKQGWIIKRLRYRVPAERYGHMTMLRYCNKILWNKWMTMQCWWCWLTCAEFSVMPQTASDKFATDVQNVGVAMLPCLADALIPVIDSASNWHTAHKHTTHKKLQTKYAYLITISFLFQRLLVLPVIQRYNVTTILGALAKVTPGFNVAVPWSALT